MRPKPIRKSMTNRYKKHARKKRALFQMFSRNGRFWDPLQNPMGAKIRSGSAEGPSRACLHGFRQSLFPYLALHLTSHHLFFMLSHWVSVSAGNPAIAVARKVRVLGAPEIENGSPFSFQNCLFVFSTFPKIMKKPEKCLFFNTFQCF